MAPARSACTRPSSVLVGHGFGGSAAVFAAAGMPAKPKVVALFPTVTKPPAEQPAATLQVPGLMLAAPAILATLRSNAVELARWKGATLRTVKAQGRRPHRGTPAGPG